MKIFSETVSNLQGLKRLKVAFVGIVVCYLILQFLWPQFPMRWPDEILFYSSGRDLIEQGIWHLPIWSYLDPSYDRTNFVLPPLNSIIFYLWTRLAAIESTEFFNYFQIIFSVLGVYILWRWFNEYREAAGWRKAASWAIFLTSPVIYYNLHIIRPEPIIFVLSLALLYLMWRYPKALPLKRRIPYLIAFSLILCLSAYLHYNAILLAPFVVIFIFRRSKGFFLDLFLVFLFSLIGMIPWIWMVIANYEGFAVQFLDQTGRMYEHGVVGTFLAMYGELFKINRCGLVGCDPFSLPIVLYKWLVLILFSLLVIYHIARRSLSHLSLRLILCLIVSAVFTIYHWESWFRFYYEYMMLVCIFFMLLDIRGRIGSRVFSLAGLALAAYSLFVIFLVIITYPSRYYSSRQFDKAVDCLVEEIPDGARLVVNAQPDPSVAILLKKPSVEILRMVDYPDYADQWIDLVAQESWFLTSNFGIRNFDGRGSIVFDHYGVLKDKIEDSRTEGKIDTKKCMAGKIPIFLHHTQ